MNSDTPANQPEPAAITDLLQFRAGEPGIYPGISFEEYLASPLMSQSILKYGRDQAGSMLHLRYAMESGFFKNPTDAMRLGSALHCAFLEPELLPLKVVTWEGGTRRGREWDAFKVANASKTILTPPQYEKLQGMIEALRRDPGVAEWSGLIDHTECTAIGIINGLKIRCRTDALTPAPLFDLKMISSTDDRTIDRRIFDFGYHIQGYIYCRVFNRERFVLGFIEENPPHDVRLVELSQDWIKVGKAETDYITQRVRQCLKAKSWPGRSLAGTRNIEEREPPAWVIQQSGIGDDITIGGTAAFGASHVD